VIAPVSVLFSEPKIPQLDRLEVVPVAELAVSVLFSEPKIPQSPHAPADGARAVRFSALQRAENSSIARGGRGALAPALFQCSSASRKFLNALRCARRHTRLKVSVLFSEPKIPQCHTHSGSREQPYTFQCSSASRKFLNRDDRGARRARRPVSVLFSEPKIPQCSCAPAWTIGTVRRFSALQRAENSSMIARCDAAALIEHRFSALQRAENSSMLNTRRARKRTRRVSVLFSEPKIPQCSRRLRRSGSRAVSVLFSEPKIPQYGYGSGSAVVDGTAFQCSSASRKFLNHATQI